MGYFTNSSTATREWRSCAEHHAGFTARSQCSKPKSEAEALNAPQLPPDVQSYFAAVVKDGYPESNVTERKVQPWKKIWEGFVEPTEDGKLFVACPKVCVYGSNLGGY